MNLHKCKKPFLCSCEVEELAEKTSDKIMEVVKEHFEQRQQAGQHETMDKHKITLGVEGEEDVVGASSADETIVMRWEKGQPPTDDDGNSLPVMGKILHNENYTVAPVQLWNYKWHWIEGGKKMSDDFEVVEWMDYPTA